jgi:CDP-glucose 4,6-dehydratase
VTNDNDILSLETNIAGTYNLYHAIRTMDKNIRSIVHISTDKVYGYGNLSRETPLRGVHHPYNASKLCGDVIAQMYASYFGLPIRIIRTGNIYGPGDKHFDRIVPGTIKATLEGRPVQLRSDGKAVRDYIYIDDVIPAYMRIADEPPGIYNLGGEMWSVLDLVRFITELMGRKDLQPVILNNAKAELSFQHVTDCPAWWERKTSMREGLEKTIAYYERMQK